ncbi:MAG: hypothetical protein AAFQ22_07735 [Pseudomonadota bacterium]
MTQVAIDFYNVLLKAGIEDDVAKRVANEVMFKPEAKDILATKTDLQSGLAETKISLIKWMVGLMLANVLGMAGIVAALVPVVS